MQLNPVQWLKLFGYMPDISLEGLASPVVDPRSAVQAMQIADGGVGAVDGWIGRRTATAMQERLCLHPDVAEEELAEADPEKIARLIYGSDSPAVISVCRCVQTMHSRMLAATGSGSWPAGCHKPIYPNHHCATYFVDYDSFTNNWTRPVQDSELQQVVNVGTWGTWGTWGVTREWLFQQFAGKSLLKPILWLMSETARKVGCAMVEVTDRARADVIVICRFIPGSTIGLGWFPSGSCRDVVEFHIDSSHTTDLDGGGWLFGHEAFHCLRFAHTFQGQDSHRGLMSYRPKYPFEGMSTGHTPYSLPRDPSVAVAMRYFGSKDGEPVPVPPLTLPKPPETRVTLPLDLVYWDSERDSGLARHNDKLLLIRVVGKRISYEEL